MRCAATVMLVVVLGLGGLAGCNDVRDFAGTWRGDRVREWPSPAIGVADSALLTIDAIDKHGLRGSLHVSTFFSEGGPLVDSTFSSLEAAEGDVLASMTFADDPLRVYLAFVPLMGPDAGEALAIIALYDSHRIELRLLAGNPAPLYVIFPLTESQ